MQTVMDEGRLKQVFKEALIEMLEEKQNLVHDIVVEAMEDLTLSRAIQKVEKAKDIHSIRNLKKLNAQGNHYRIRIGDFRLGLVIEDDTVCGTGNPSGLLWK